jgi:hypothetical protein
MHKVYVLVISFTIFAGFCSSSDQPAIVNIIVYEDFADPKKTYDSLVQDFNESELVDSIKIIGRPVSVPVVKFKFDTLRVERYGVDFKEIDSLVKTLSHKSFDIDKLNNMLVDGYDGVKIPISAISDIILEQEHYRPEIFLPTPECFKFKNECVVKVELFCKRKNMRKLINFIQENIPKYTTGFTNENWRYEIVKGKLPNEEE